jgi:hypothetical protein
MLIKTSIGFLVADEEVRVRVCIRFTDFGSKFIRHLFYPPWAGLSAGCVADWRTVFGKSSCGEKFKPIITRDNKDLHLVFQGTVSNFPFRQVI